MAVDRGPYVIAGIQVPGFFPDMGPKGWQQDDLALRQVVIVGRIVTKEPAAFGGQAHVYTPFVVEVERVIHGEVSLGPTRVSIEGGTVGCYEVNVDTAPVLQVGSRYVLFLISPAGTDPPPGVSDVWMVDDQDVVLDLRRPDAPGAAGRQDRSARGRKQFRYPLTSVLSAAFTRSSRPAPTDRSAKASRDACLASAAE